MRARDQTEFLRTVDTSKQYEILYCFFIGSFSMIIVQILEPLDLRRHIGELLELRSRKKRLSTYFRDLNFFWIHRQDLLLIKSVIKSKVAGDKLHAGVKSFSVWWRAVSSSRQSRLAALESPLAAPAGV